MPRRSTGACSGPVVWSGVKAAHFPQAFCDTLASRAEDTVGLKTITAYRTTFAIDQTPPSVVEVKEDTDAWYRAVDRIGEVRLENVDVVHFGLWSGAELARDLAIPLQIHVGFGDPDITMHACDPTHFAEFLRAMEAREVDCTLLHNYPFQREAARLAEIFRNVCYDVGVILNYAGPQAASIMGEALEMGPFFKQLCSSDAFGLAELHYLGQRQCRRTLARHLDRWIGERICTLAEADRIVAMIASGNASRIYGRL